MPYLFLGLHKRYVRSGTYSFSNKESHKIPDFLIAQLDTIINSDDCLYLDEGFSVNFIIFDNLKKKIPQGQFNTLISKRPLSLNCAKIVICFKDENCKKFQSFLKSGIIDLTLFSNENCLILALSFGIYFIKNKCNVKFCVERIFNVYLNNLKSFCEMNLGAEMIKNILACTSLSQEIEQFSKEFSVGIVLFNLKNSRATIMSKKSVNSKELPIYILYDELNNHCAFLYDLALRYVFLK